MSLLELPDPPDWRRSRGVGYVLVLLSVVVAGVYCVLGAVAAFHGRYLTTVVSVGWAVFLLLLALGAALVMSGRMTPQIVCDRTGFTLRPDLRFSKLILAGLLAIIPSTLLFVVFAPMGAIDFATTRALQVFWPIFAALALVTVITGLIRTWRRGDVGHVTLTPAMVENADVMSTKLFEWDDIVEVSGRAESMRAHRAVVLHLRNGDEAVIGNASVYVPGGAVLYWMVRHYWKHPEDRDELVDERALQRFEQRKYDVS